MLFACFFCYAPVRATRECAEKYAPLRHANNRSLAKRRLFRRRRGVGQVLLSACSVSFYKERSFCLHIPDRPSSEIARRTRERRFFYCPSSYRPIFFLIPIPMSNDLRTPGARQKKRAAKNKLRRPTFALERASSNSDRHAVDKFFDLLGDASMSLNDFV